MASGAATFTVSSAVDVALLTLAVMAVAVGSLNDTRRSLAVVAVAVPGGRLLEGERGQEEGQDQKVNTDTAHFESFCFVFGKRKRSLDTFALAVDGCE